MQTMSNSINGQDTVSFKHSEAEAAQHIQDNKLAPVAIGIFGVAVLYYSFAYLLRVYPGVMEMELSQYYEISAGSFGLLTSFYYFAYAPMQFPVGVSVDKIGPRRSLLTACVIATTGAFLFSTSTSYNIALLGRFMIGMGSSFAYVTALKLATIWLPARYFGTAAGTLTGLGMFAAIMTDIILTRLIESAGFQHTLQIPVIMGLVLFCLILLVVRDKPKNHQSIMQPEGPSLTFRQLGHYLVDIVKNPQMWLIGVIGSLMYLPSSTFLDVWAIPYLKRAYGMTAHEAAYATSIMFLGWIVSTFSVGAISDVFQNRKLPLIIATTLATIIACLLFYIPNMNQNLVYFLLFMFGMSCGPHPLCFTLSKELFPKEVAGSAIAFANCCIMLGGLIFQPLVGKILDVLWDGTVHNGIRVYTPENFQVALTIIPVALVISSLLTLLIKEKRPS